MAALREGGQMIAAFFFFSKQKTAYEIVM